MLNLNSVNELIIFDGFQLFMPRKLTCMYCLLFGGFHTLILLLVAQWHHAIRVMFIFYTFAVALKLPYYLFAVLTEFREWW